jgi:hypothetical protein
MENLTGPEKVLYKATYNFAIEVLKLSEEDARTEAELKIKQKRKLANKVSMH